MARPFAALPLLLAPCVAHAAELAPAAPSVGGSLVQVALGLVVVVGLILGTAWLGRRLGLANPTRGSALKIVSSASVGTRERVVVVETGDTWLVVGVAAGSVNHLATLPRGELPAPAAAPLPPFAAKLAQLLEKNRAR